MPASTSFALPTDDNPLWWQTFGYAILFLRRAWGREGRRTRENEGERKMCPTPPAPIWLNPTHISTPTLSHSFSRKPFLVRLPLKNLPLLSIALLCLSTQFAFGANPGLALVLSVKVYVSVPIWLISSWQNFLAFQLSTIPSWPLAQNYLVNLTRVNQSSMNE